ncbi:hypothetical protein ACFWMS_28185 [Peribacillus butanolivorans]|uniref:hypothetical protein n=1 Tax=Peribacillus butanolivorans TaxID=421767 RepID=UPI00365D833F
MTTKQRQGTSIVVLALVAATLAATSAAWPFWVAFGVITVATSIELARATHG